MPGFEVTTLYGLKTRKPLVQIKIRGPKERPNELQLDIETARAFALNILQATESAIQDAFIIEFFQEIGLSEEERQALLAAFRERRHDRQNDTTA